MVTVFFFSLSLRSVRRISVYISENKDRQRETQVLQDRRVWDEDEQGRTSRAASDESAGGCSILRLRSVGEQKGSGEQGEQRIQA